MTLTAPGTRLGRAAARYRSGPPLPPTTTADGAHLITALPPTSPQRPRGWCFADFRYPDTPPLGGAVTTTTTDTTTDTDTEPGPAALTTWLRRSRRLLLVLDAELTQVRAELADARAHAAALAERVDLLQAANEAGDPPIGTHLTPADWRSAVRVLAEECAARRIATAAGEAQ